MVCVSARCKDIRLTAAHHAGQLQFFGERRALTEFKAFAAFLKPLRQSAAQEVQKKVSVSTAQRRRRVKTPSALVCLRLRPPPRSARQCRSMSAPRRRSSRRGEHLRGFAALTSEFQHGRVVLFDHETKGCTGGQKEHRSRKKATRHKEAAPTGGLFMAGLRTYCRAVVPPSMGRIAPFT